jgi:pimeloyl-ACP methyl ester carboxylesterase
VRLNTATLGADGPPAVFLHGLLVGNLAPWYFGAARALSTSARAPHRVLCYDLRGHGLSERPATGYDLATMADDLAALVADFAGGAPVTLVGHSFGALVALEHARRHPAGVRRLVLVEAPLRGTERDELLAFLARAPEEQAAALPTELQAALGAGGRRARRLLESLLGLALQTSLLDDLAALGELPDEHLRAVRAPALLVYGTRSACGPSGERLLRTLPAAALAWVEGGHYLPLDAPAEVTRLVLEFCEESKGSDQS